MSPPSIKNEAHKRPEELLEIQRDLSRSLSAAVNLDEALRACLATAIDATHMDSGGMYLVDPNTGNVDLACTQGLSDAFIQAGGHYDGSSSHARLITAGTPVYSTKLEMASLLNNSQKKEMLRALAILPVTHDQKVIACLNVASHSVPEIDTSTRNTLEAICVECGNAISRLRAEEDRRRAEEMMIQAEKMLMVGGLAAGMAHEINNPLAGIMHALQVIRNRLEGQSTKDVLAAEQSGIALPAMQEFLDKRNILNMMEQAIDAGKRASEIVNNMLSFARKSDTEKEPHMLQDLLDRTLELCKNEYDAGMQYDFNSIELIREYEPHLPPVLCESGKIQQVFFNIIKNCTQAMADSAVATPMLFLRATKKGNLICVEIEDNGPGMDEDTRNRIFEPFFTTKSVGNGMGLGLSISYFIVTENHQGTIAVESTPGVGTKFIVRLPQCNDIKPN